MTIAELKKLLDTFRNSESQVKFEDPYGGEIGEPLRVGLEMLSDECIIVIGQ